MEEYIDLGRQTMPRAVKHIIWSLFSVLLLFYAMNSGDKPPLLYIVVVSFSGIIFGLAFYGIVSIVRDYKKTMTVEGMLKEIKNTYKDAKK